MKYFLDTEFIEDGKTIDLISIGLVCEDGREYYAINKECDFSKADNWVVDNVLNPIGLNKSGFYRKGAYIGGPAHTALEVANKYDESKKFVFPKNVIKKQILDFLGWTVDGFSPYDELRCASGNLFIDDCFIPEFWADYCSYDWVVFCQLFGKMIDLPEGFPMYCNDIQQLWRSKGCPELPKQKAGQHNALEDAKYVKELYELLIAN